MGFLNLPGIPPFDEPALSEQKNPISDLVGALHVVRHGDESAAGLFPQLANQIRDRTRSDGIEARRRFVVEDHFGLDDERARDSEALLHPARDFVGVEILVSRKTDGAEKFIRPFASLLADDPFALFQRKEEVFLDGERVKERVFLKEHADVLASNMDFSDALGDQACDDLEEHALAATRRADDDDGFSQINIETDVAEDPSAAEFFSTPWT